MLVGPRDCARGVVFLAHAYACFRIMEALARWGAGVLRLGRTHEQPKSRGATSTAATPPNSTEATHIPYALSSDEKGTPNCSPSRRRACTPELHDATRSNPGAEGEAGGTTRNSPHEGHVDAAVERNDCAPTNLHTRSLIPEVVPPWEVPQGFESDGAAVEYSKKYAIEQGFKANLRDSAKVSASYTSGYLTKKN